LFTVVETPALLFELLLLLLLDIDLSEVNCFAAEVVE